jgi:hypothetical protein
MTDCPSSLRMLDECDGEDGADTRMLRGGVRDGAWL